MKRADAVSVGDTLSTDGARIEAAVLCKTVGRPDDDEVCIVGVLDDGFQKIQYVSPSALLPVWTPDKAGS